MAGWNEPQAARDLLAVVGRRGPPEEVAGAEPEAAAVDEQVAHRQLARDERIPHRERRQVADDRRVPLDLAFFDEQAERGRGERLRVRRDAEQRARVHRRRLAEFADAVPFRHDHDVVFHDRDADARHVEGLHGARDPLVKIGRRRGSLRHQRRGQREQKDQATEKYPGDLRSSGGWALAA